MPTSGKVSCVIPARNEPYLKQTIQSLLDNSRGEIEVIAVLDGYWPPPEELVIDKRVLYLNFGASRGMRNAINSGVAIAKGEFILKSDAHCLYSKGWDTALKHDLEDNWIAVPRRYALDVDKWAIEQRPDNKYPVDYMYLSRTLHGEPWVERRDDPNHKDKQIDDLMSAQGSCWFMKKDYFNQLELLDESSYGTFYSEFQEIGLKCWLSGGRIIVNKNVYYAHWHKPKDRGRGYKLSSEEQQIARNMVDKWNSKEKAWSKQIHQLEWLVERFKPVPTW